MLTGHLQGGGCLVSVTPEGVLNHLTHPPRNVADRVIRAMLSRDASKPWQRHELTRQLPADGKSALQAVFRLIASRALTIDDALPLDTEPIADLDLTLQALAPDQAAMLLDAEGFTLASVGASSATLDAWALSTLTDKPPTFMQVLDLYPDDVISLRLLLPASVPLAAPALVALGQVLLRAFCRRKPSHLTPIAS